VADFGFGPGSDSVAVQVLAPPVGADRWDQATWGPDPAQGHWSDLEWQDVDCQVNDAQWTWACQRDVGILSVSEAGSLDLSTFDPDRQLDPSNVTGPFFRQVRPGTAIRILGPRTFDDDMPHDITLTPVWSGWVDELSYDVASQTGRLRCTDPIALMSQTPYHDAGLPSPLPNTLRARIHRVLVDAGIDDLVPFAWLMELEDGEVDEDPPVAPFVAPTTGTPPNVWKVIQDACADALWLAWIDGSGRLVIGAWDSFAVSAISLGCGPAEDPAFSWVDNVTSIEFGQTSEGIRNSVVCKVGGVDSAPMQDRQSVDFYGVREYKVDREVPDRVTWGQTILDDRADASLTVSALETRPADVVELANLLDFIRLGPQQTRLRDDNHPPLIDLDVTVIGMSVEVSPDGWVFTIVSSLSRAAFDALEPPVPTGGVITIIQEADGVIGDPSGAITLPSTPIPGNVLLLWHAVATDLGPTPPGFIAHPSGPVFTGGTPPPPPLTLVQQKVGQFDGGAATTLTFDTAPTAGNLLVACLSERGGAGSRATPSGWGIASDFVVISNDRETMYWRSAPGGAVTVTVAGATNHRRMVIMEFGPATLQSGLTLTPKPAASSHPVGPVLPTASQSVLIGYVGAYDTGGGRHTTLINDPAFIQVDQGTMDSGFAPSHIVSYKVVPPGSYTFTPTSDQGAFGGAQWAGALISFGGTP
jgi:hypothetical protein